MTNKSLHFTQKNYQHTDFPSLWAYAHDVVREYKFGNVNL